MKNADPTCPPGVAPSIAKIGASYITFTPPTSQSAGRVGPSGLDDNVLPIAGPGNTNSTEG